MDSRPQKNLDEQLIEAAERQQYSYVKSLLEKKANPHAKDKNGNAALIIATFNKDKDTLQVLIDGGADINIKNQYGETALTMAVRKKMENIAVWLIDAKADPDIQTDKAGTTAFHWVFESYQFELVRKLLDVKATPWLRIENGNTAFEIAASRGHRDVLQAALARPDARENIAANLYSMHFLIHLNMPDIMKQFVAFDTCNTNHRFSWGDTPLINAVFANNYPTMVEVLIDAKADVDAVNEKHQHSAMSVAISNDREDIMVLLLLAGARVSDAPPLRFYELLARCDVKDELFPGDIKQEEREKRMLAKYQDQLMDAIDAGLPGVTHLAPPLRRIITSYAATMSGFAMTFFKNEAHREKLFGPAEASSPGVVPGLSG